MTVPLADSSSSALFICEALRIAVSMLAIHIFLHGLKSAVARKPS